MSRLIFSENAFEEYKYWQTQDKKTLKKIHNLIADIQRNGYSGLGQPELLSGNLSGFASRRIDEANRIVYRITEAGIEITQCKGHYSDK
jgi:toxin YoeB